MSSPALNPGWNFAHRRFANLNPNRISCSPDGFESTQGRTRRHMSIGSIFSVGFDIRTGNVYPIRIGRSDRKYNGTPQAIPCPDFNRWGVVHVQTGVGERYLGGPSGFQSEAEDTWGVPLVTSGRRRSGSDSDLKIAGGQFSAPDGNICRNTNRIGFGF